MNFSNTICNSCYTDLILILIFKKIHLNIYYVYEYFVCYNMCMPSAFGSQRMVLDPLELELKRVVSCHMSAGSLEEQPVLIATEPPFQPH